MKTPFLGGFNVSRSENLAANRLLNLYPELGGEGAQEAGGFYPTPGLEHVGTIGDGPIRGIWPVFDNGMAIVSGSKIYAVGPDFLGAEIGTVGGTGPVSMANSPESLLIVANPNTFQYDFATEAFAQVTLTDYPSAQTVAYQGGFFIFNSPDTELVYIYDGVTFDPLDVASTEGAPDYLRAVFVDHNELWMFSTNSVEVWANVGAADFPYAPISSAFMEVGCAAPFSPAKGDNTLFWLGSDPRSSPIVWRANGYSPVRVSTNAIENAIQSYSTVADAIGWCYQQEGHTFYVLTFPMGNATWVYDASTNMWHERAYMNPTTGQLERHRANCHTYFQGQHIVGDRTNGKIYRWSLDKLSDDGDAIPRVRSWRALPTGQNNLTRSFQHALQLVCQSGVGLNTGQGSNPQVMLRWSDDGGHTWSNEHWRSLGLIGQHGKRVIWRKLGSTEKLRDRVYEVSMTDPVKVAWLGAELQVSGAMS